MIIVSHPTPSSIVMRLKPLLPDAVRFGGLLLKRGRPAVQDEHAAALYAEETFFRLANAPQFDSWRDADIEPERDCPELADAHAHRRLVRALRAIVGA